MLNIYIKHFSNLSFNSLAKMVIESLLLPQTVMRMSGSVPEGRTRRRPFSDSSFWLYSRRSFLICSEDLRLSFCSGEASTLMITWGDFDMILAS